MILCVCIYIYIYIFEEYGTITLVIFEAVEAPTGTAEKWQALTDREGTFLSELCRGYLCWGPDCRLAVAQLREASCGPIDAGCC